MDNFYHTAPPPELRQPLQQPMPLVVSAPSFVPSQDHGSQWQPMPINQWDPQSQTAQPQSQQMVIGKVENICKIYFNIQSYILIDVDHF